MTHCHTLIDRLRSRGYRITPQREMVIQTIAHSSNHMTAEEVLSVVQHRSHAVNIATIYRTLDILVREGIASRIDLGAGHALYATIKHGPHIHLYCRQCGMVIEVAQQDIAPYITTFYETMQQQYGFTPDRQHLALPGLCDQCSAKQTVESSSNACNVKETIP